MRQSGTTYVVVGGGSSCLRSPSLSLLTIRVPNLPGVVLSPISDGVLDDVHTCLISGKSLRPYSLLIGPEVSVGRTVDYLSSGGVHVPVRTCT